MRILIILIFLLITGGITQAQVQLTSIKKSEEKFKLPIAQRELAGQTGYFLEYGDLLVLMDSLGIVIETVDSLVYNPTTDSLSLYTSEGVYKTLIPGSTGTVKGTGTATRVAWWAASDSLSSSTELYWDTLNKRLGVGTSSPTKALDVTTDALIHGATVGLGAGSQPFNMVLGNGALGANTTGNYNVAFGSGALGANTTGSSNVAIGSGALITPTTADDNTAIGRNALTSNTTGTANFGLGSNALSGNTTGQQNVNTGYLSGQSNTTGSYNCGYGSQTLRTGASKSYNTAMGYFALSASNGNNNSAIGAFALSAITTGVNNTAMGYAAGGNATTGDGGIFLGNRAGIYETGSNRLIISSVNPSNESDGRSKAIIHGQQSSTTSSQILDLNAKTKVTYKPNAAVKIAGYDSSEYFSDVTIGSGLSLTGGTLSSTGGPDSTIVTEGWGIDVTESPLNTFTVKADTSQLATQHDISDLVREARTINTTAPLTGGGDLSTNRTFAITQGTTSTDGYISSTDWNTFNAKPNGSGSAGRVAWWNGTSSLTSDINLFWDDTNNYLGIGTTSPGANLHVTGNVRIEGGTGTPTTIMGRNSTGYVNQIAIGSGLNFSSGTLSNTGDLSGTNELQTISTTGAAGNITLSNGGGTLNLNVNDADASTTNELQTLSWSSPNLSISSGNSVALPVLPAGTSSYTLAYLSGAWTASAFLKTNSSTTTTGNSKRVTINDDIGGETWPLSIHTGTKFLVNGKVQLNSTASTAVTSIMGRNDIQEVGTVTIGPNMELTTSGTLNNRQVLGVLARSSGSASFSTSSTPAKLDFNQAMVQTNATANASNDDIVTTITGYGAYEITCDCQFNAGGTTTYNFGIYVNGSLNGSLVKQIPMTSGTTVDVIITGYVSSLATTDEVDIRVSTGSGTSGNTIGRCLLALKGI